MNETARGAQAESEKLPTTETQAAVKKGREVAGVVTERGNCFDDRHAGNRALGADCTKAPGEHGRGCLRRIERRR